MFLNVSEEFKNKIASFSRSFRARLVFDTFTIDDGIYSVKIKGGSNLDEELTLGTTTSATVDVELEEQSRSLKNQKFALEIGLILDSGEIEYLPFGVYHIRTAVTKDKKTTITAADTMYLAEKAYKTSLNYPVTADYVVNEICNILGVSHDIAGLENIVIFSSPAAMTIREVIGYISALLGKNAYFDRYGNLAFAWYSDSGYSTNGDYISDADIDESDFVVDYVMADVTDRITLVSGDENSEQGIKIQNPYATDEIIQSVYSSVGGFSYRPCSFKQILGDIRIDVFDIIEIQTKSGNFKTIPMEYSLNYDGGISIEFTASAPDTDKEILSPSEIQAQKTANTNRNNTLVVTSTNAKAVNVNAEEKELLTLDFSTQSESIPYINATVQLEDATNGVVMVVVRLNGSTHSVYRINADEGYNLMTFSTAFLQLMGGSHQLDLLISGGSAKVQPNGANVILTGYGLVAQAAWNGFVNLADIIAEAVVYAKNISVQSVATELDISTITPILEAITEAISDVVVLDKNVDIQPMIDNIPHSVASVRNIANNLVEITLQNPIMLENVGEIDPTAFSLQGFIGGVGSEIEVYNAGLEVAPTSNLLTENGFEIIDGKAVASVDIDSSLPYQFTLINNCLPYTIGGLQRYTMRQLEVFRVLQLEAREYQAVITFFNSDGAEIRSIQMRTTDLNIPQSATRIKVEISRVDVDNVAITEADLLYGFYAKLEQNDESTIFKFSNKIMLLTEDLSGFSPQIIYSIGDISAINPFTNEALDVSETGTFEREIFESEG